MTPTKICKVTFFCSALMICLALNSPAQTVLWAKKGISEGFENGNALVTDDSGNVYVTGQFEFTSVFDNHTLHTYGQHDILIAKYAADGTLKWIKQAGGKSGDIGNAIGIDAAHNVYVTGEIEDTVVFNPGITLMSNGANDGFIAKFDAMGNAVWAMKFGTASGSEKGRGMYVTDDGDIYVTGNFSGTTSFGGVSLTSNGGNDIFLLKMNSDGVVQWAKKAGGSAQDRSYSVTLDKNNNIYITGTFTSHATFGSESVSNSGSNSAFLAKYNSNGSCEWVVDGGSGPDTTKSSAVALDQKGNVYICGYFNVETKFESTSFNCRGVSDVFVAKYNSSGDLKWIKQAGGIEEDLGYGIAVDTLSELVYITGLVRESGTFDNLNYSVAGYKDIFIAAYDYDGDAQWLKTYGGSLRDLGNAITVDKKGYIYSTGLFNSNATFGPFVLTGYPNQPWADFYVSKIQPPVSAMPDQHANSISFISSNCSDLDLDVSGGNGNRHLVIARAGIAVNVTPVNGSSYTASTMFGSGTDLGNGNFVVYDGTDDDFTVTGLTPGATYHFQAFEFNGYGMTSSFNTSSAPSASATAATYPLTLSGLQNSVCAGTPMNLQTSGVSNCSWSPSNGLSSVSGTSVTAAPAVTTTYHVSGITSAGCLASTDFTINVTPRPVVGFSALSSVCVNTPTLALTGGTPAGGVYTGQGVSNGNFMPSVAGVGMSILEYRYTDANGCSNTAQSIIDVKALPSVSVATPPATCEYASMVLNTGSPSGGVYAGNGVSNGLFTPTSGAGNYILTYSYTNSDGCTTVKSFNAPVNARPVINLGPDKVACVGSVVTVTAPSGFSAYNWSDGTTATTASVTGTSAGTSTLSLEVTNSSGCVNNDALLITFDICAGISQVNNIESLKLYPNPFTDRFNIYSESAVSVKVLDACGRLLQERREQAGTTSFGEQLTPGIYFVEIISGDAHKVISVLKSE